MTERHLDRRLVLALAVVCGAAVANLYYAQPLLDLVARGLHVSSGTAGLIVTATQLGYAAGLALVVPLGDLLERRGLVTRILIVTALALAATAAAPSLAVLAAALAVVGVTSVVAQILVPFSATLAPEDERGRVVGIVMSGLLIGILLARTVSGLIADVAGWRSVYAIAAILMLVASALLRRALPVSKPETDLSYGALLKSVGTLVREEPVIRRRMAYGAMGMASFSALWTALTFLLSDHYGYGEAAIGLFGLFGLAGAMSAQVAGRFGDRGRIAEATGGFLVAILVGWVLLFAGHASIVAVIAGIVLLDLGIQGQQITSQHVIYARRPEARSRVTTAYMTSNFLWGALGSGGASLFYGIGGWSAVVAMGCAFAAVALLVYVHEQLAGRRKRTVHPVSKRAPAG